MNSRNTAREWMEVGLDSSGLISAALYCFPDISLLPALLYLVGALLPEADWLLDRLLLRKAKSLISKKAQEFGFRRGFHKAIFHNLWALIAFSIAISAVLPNSRSLIIFFLMGYLSHLFIDSLTRFGIFWLWPFGYVIGRERFYSNGPIFTGNRIESALHAAVVGPACLAILLRLCLA